MAVALFLLAGCGETDADDNVTTQSRALRCYMDDVPSNDADCPWRFFSRFVPGIPANDIVHSKAPALLGTPASGYLVTTVDTSKRYRMNRFTGNLHADSWVSYGTKTFDSKPALAAREEAAPGSPGFVVAGKAAAPDGKIYASPGNMSPVGDPQPNVVPAGAFAAVSNTAYTTGGNPAMATGGFAGGSSVVLVFMSDDGRTIYGHYRPLPYVQNGNFWRARITGPVLPTGWTAVGAPAITKLPVTMQIVVHARNGSGTQHRLFETHFYTDGVNGFFSSEIGSPSPTWVQLSITGAIDDDPSLSYSDVAGSTVYFRRGNQIMQTSGHPLGSNPLLALMPSAGVQVASAPAGYYAPLDQGAHVVVARTTANQLYYAESQPDSEPLGP